jgi:hypothetical protein
MNDSPDKTNVVTIRPPRLFPALRKGFNAVANNIHLLVLPIALDLFLWFGPHLRLKAILQPIVAEGLRLMRQSSSAEMRPTLDNMEGLWQVFLDRFNMLSVLSTFPIGVPSIMAGQLPNQTPLGEPFVYEITSFVHLLLGWVGLSLIGLALGSFYLANMARCCANPEPQKGEGGMRLEFEGARFNGGKVPPLRWNVLAWQTMQLLAMVIILIVLAFLILMPALMITSFVGLFSPFLAQAMLLIVAFAMVWFLVPLVFTPHGIFMGGQNVFRSLLNSARVVRFSLPGVGLFILVSVLLYQLMGGLWRGAPATSWMALVGILGHAFISTALVAASFVYYRNGLAYLQSLQRYKSA